MVLVFAPVDQLYVIPVLGFVAAVKTAVSVPGAQPIPKVDVEELIVAVGAIVFPVMLMVIVLLQPLPASANIRV